MEIYCCGNEHQPHSSVCQSCSVSAEPLYNEACIVGGEEPLPVEQRCQQGNNAGKQKYELYYTVQYHLWLLLSVAGVHPWALSSISAPSRVMSASPMLSLTICPITLTSFIAATFS